MRIKSRFKKDDFLVEYFINVSSEGRFTAYLPEDIVKKLEDCGIHVPSGRGNKKGYFEAESRHQIDNDIHAVISKMTEKKLVSSTVVLRYKITTLCTYSKDKGGEIIPNGYWAKKPDDSSWVTGTVDLHAARRSPFGFTVFVRPKKLNVFRFPDKTEHKEYERLEESEVEEGSTLHWLNSVVAIDYDCSDHDLKEIEYSEKAGLFFKNMLMFVFSLNERLQAIFGEHIEIELPKIKMLPFSDTFLTSKDTLTHET